MGRPKAVTKNGNNYGLSLKTLMHARGISNREVARDIGCTPHAIAHHKGRTAWTRAQIDKFTSYLGVSEEELLRAGRAAARMR